MTAAEEVVEGLIHAQTTRCAIEGPSPCDDCSNWDKCKTGKACVDFAFFVETGRVMSRYRQPQRKTLERVMDEKQTQLPWKRLYSAKKRGRLIGSLLADEGLQL